MIESAAVFRPAAIAWPLTSDITNITRTGLVIAARSLRSVVKSSPTAEARHVAALSAPMAWPISAILSSRPCSEYASGTDTSGMPAEVIASIVCFGPAESIARISVGFRPITPSDDSCRK